MNKINLKDVKTEDLMSEVLHRNDIIIIGNYFLKEHISSKMNDYGICPTASSLEKIFDKYCGLQLGLEFANDDLEQILLEEFQT